MPLPPLSNEEILELTEHIPVLWVLQNDIKTSDGRSFEFDKHKFMVDFLNDLSPLQVLLKPPQVGASETEIVKSFFVAHQLKKDIIYTLPTQTDVYDMVGSKVNRIVAQNPILKEWVKDHDTVEQKSVGQNIIHYRGTFSQKQAMMVSSALNIHDEVDASDLSVITQYENRLQAQEDGGMRWYFSHPSLKGMGVDVYWERSDKKEWVITCPDCTQEQVLTWPNSISRERMCYVCKKCDAELPNSTRINGYWHKTAKGDFSGYHVSQLMLYHKSPKDILEAYDDPLKDKQYFYNYVLGLPYVGGDDQITAEQVLKNCTPDTNSQEGKIIIGVDTGLPIYYVLLNREGVFYYGSCKPSVNGSDPYDDLRTLLKRFRNSVLVSDQGGDLIGIRKLQGEFPGRVFLAYYRKDRKSNEIVTWGEGEKYGDVYIDRNRQIQLLIEQLKETGRLKFNGTKDEWKEYADHFASMYREKVVVKETKDKDDRSLYGAEYVWKRRSPDHWAHATLYGITGLQKYGQSLASTTTPDILSTLQVGVTDAKFTGEVILRALSEDSPFKI